MSSLVGEEGPELFLPDTAEQIINNNDLSTMLVGGSGTDEPDKLLDAIGRLSSGGSGIHIGNIDIDARGAELGVEQWIMSALASLHNSIEPRALAAVNAQRQRGGAWSMAFKR
jgi:hypothetical protein